MAGWGDQGCELKIAPKSPEGDFDCMSCFSLVYILQFYKPYLAFLQVQQYIFTPHNYRDGEVVQIERKICPNSPKRGH